MSRGCQNALLPVDGEHISCTIGPFVHLLFSSVHSSLHKKQTMQSGGHEGEVAFFSAKRWDLRNRADLKVCDPLS